MQFYKYVFFFLPLGHDCIYYTVDYQFLPQSNAEVWSHEAREQKAVSATQCILLLIYVYSLRLD